MYDIYNGIMEDVTSDILDDINDIYDMSYYDTESQEE